MLWLIAYILQRENILGRKKGMKNKILTFGIGAALMFLTVGCETTNTNTSSNSNQGNLSSNNQRANTNTNSNMANENTNRNTNREMTREEVEKNKDSIMEDAKKAGRKIGNGAEDVWLWVKTRAAMAADEDLRVATIDVDVENNVVTLSGTVGTAAQKTKAQQVAKDIEGVKSVKNMLKVAPDNASRTDTEPKK